MIFSVMDMQEQKRLPRLKSHERIGQRHIAVQRKKTLNYPQHWHEYFEVEVVMAGEGTHHFNGTPYPMSQGDAYLLTPVDFHRIETDTEMELINISFDETWLSETMRTYLYTSDLSPARKFSAKEQKRFCMVAELLLEEYRENGACISQLLEYLLSQFIRGTEEYGTRQGHLSGLNAAISYMELHFREKITLAQLAELSGYTPNYFSNLFRRAMGETYIERLTFLRINYAKRLLESGFSVTDACFNSGFGSLSNFNAVFKEKIGVSASEYKKNTAK